MEPIQLTAAEQRDFYLGFSNKILWPLCHGQQERCNFEPRYWDVYRTVNRKFSDAVCRIAEPGDFLWIHDYHLMAAAEELRNAGCSNRAGFFLHIPFPAPDIFEQLPWSGEVLKSLLHYDVLGFQTRRDRWNFTQCLSLLAPDAVELSDDRVRWKERTTRLGVFPISIDPELFFETAREADVAEEAASIREDIGTEKILLGVDRLDYTKGIPQKLRGLERALEKYPELRGRVTLVQLVVPSRVKIPEYHEMKEEIEQMVGRINGRFTRRGWAPILYEFDSRSQKELLAWYRAADVALVTSLRDGMNLVSKEFCAASVERGVLVLSAFAGSVDELAGEEPGRDALLVNPHDVDGVADAIHRACTMEDDEMRARLDRLQSHIRGNTVHDWVESFLEAALGDDPAASGTAETETDRRPAHEEGTSTLRSIASEVAGRLQKVRDPAPAAPFVQASGIHERPADS